MQLRFTTYVVITMKSPQLLTTLCTIWLFAHDLLSRHSKTISSQQLRLLSHNTCINVTCRSLNLAKLFLLIERARCDTNTRVTCLLLDASSDSSSYTSARSTSCRIRLHDPRSPASTSRTFAQTCNGLSASAPAVQLPRQIQESATGVRPHVHAG